MARVLIHAAALADLVEHFGYLAEQAGLATVNRFLERADACFALLGLDP